MAIKQIFNTSAELNYPSVLPTLDLDFANSKTLDPRITFRRASGGSYFGPDGRLRYAGVNEPRFTHDPVTGESLGLLVEESRTNLLVRSEDFSTTWLNTNSSDTANTEVAPNGTTTADTLTANAGTGLKGIAQPITLSGTYTYSIFLKAGTHSIAQLLFGGSGNGGAAFANFNLSTGTIGSTSGTSSIVAVGNGWYRCIFTGDFTGGSSVYITFVDSATATRSAATTSTGTLLLWGAQLEAGAFPASYIPTTTAAATRSADVASISGSNFSSWFNANETTLRVEGKFVGGTASTFPRVVSLTSSSTNNDDIGIAWTANTSFMRAAVASGGSTSVDLSAGPVKTAGSKYAVAFAVSAINAQFASDSVLGIEDSSVTLPACDRLLIAQPVRFQGVTNTTIRRLTYWPRRLGNEVLQSITQ